MVVGIDRFQHPILEHPPQHVALDPSPFFRLHAAAQQFVGHGEVIEDLVVAFAVVGENPRELTLIGSVRGQAADGVGEQQEQLDGALEAGLVLIHAPHDGHMHRARRGRLVEQAGPAVVHGVVVLVAGWIDAGVGLGREVLAAGVAMEALGVERVEVQARAAIGTREVVVHVAADGREHLAELVAGHGYPRVHPRLLGFIDLPGPVVVGQLVADLGQGVFRNEPRGVLPIHGRDTGGQYRGKHGGGPPSLSEVP